MRRDGRRARKPSWDASMPFFRICRGGKRADGMAGTSRRRRGRKSTVWAMQQRGCMGACKCIALRVRARRGRGSRRNAGNQFAVAECTATGVAKGHRSLCGTVVAATSEPSTRSRASSCSWAGFPSIRAGLVSTLVLTYSSCSLVQQATSASVLTLLVGSDKTVSSRHPDKTEMSVKPRPHKFSCTLERHY